MIQFQILRLATSVGIAIAAYLCRTFVTRWLNNIFKTNSRRDHRLKALKKLDTNSSNEKNNQSDKMSYSTRMTSRLGLGISWTTSYKNILPSPDFPSIKLLRNERYYIFPNPITGIPAWTLERVTDEILKDYNSCRFCETKPKAENREGMQFAYDLIHTSAQSLIDIDPCVFQTIPPQLDQSNAQCTKIWDDFFHYVKFLTKKHKTVYVCSGPLYTRKYADTEVRYNNAPHSGNPRTIVQVLTHFFKVVIAQYSDKTYRFECYKIPNERTTLEHAKLKKCLIPRWALEKHAGFLICSDMEDHKITEPRTDPDFNPNWKCPRCLFLQRARF